MAVRVNATAVRAGAKERQRGRSAEPGCHRAALRSGAGAGRVTISWLAVAGVNYQVQFSTNLAAGGWLPVGNFLATGTNAALDDVSPPAPQRFYRVRILP